MTSGIAQPGEVKDLLQLRRTILHSASLLIGLIHSQIRLQARQSHAALLWCFVLIFPIICDTNQKILTSLESLLLSVTTITALLDPIVEQLQHFYYGQVIHTYRHQAGIIKRVVLLPAIGDLLTICKALGFTGVTSHHFCSFYTLHKSDIENLDSGAWKLWKGTEVIAVVEQWCQVLTKKKQEFIFKKHSICWSSLHQLLYCDLV